MTNKKYKLALIVFLISVIFISGCVSNEQTSDLNSKTAENKSDLPKENEESTEMNPELDEEKNSIIENETLEVPNNELNETQIGSISNETVKVEEDKETILTYSWKKGELAIEGKYADADIIDLGNGNYRIYYAAEPEIQNFEGQVYSATSSDGINWETEDGTRKTWATFPSVIKLYDGKYRMYFQNAGVIKSATSFNGLEWEDEDGTRIDTKNSEGMEFENVAAPTVIKINEEYVMVYRGTIDEKYPEMVPNNNMQLFLWATSNDGLNFEKKGIALDSRNDLLKGLADGPEFVEWDDGEIRLYFWSYKGVFHLTFEDGTFSEPEFDYSTDPDSRKMFPENPPGDPTLMKINEKWFMYYGSHTKGIGYATLEQDYN